jgi:hypothetical protein
MAGALSNYAEGAIAHLLLRGTAFTSPGVVYLALFTSDPGEAGSGSETTYTNYTRVSCGATPSAAFTAIDSTGMTQNANTIVFPAVGGVSSVTITHWALFDALTTGNMLLFGPLTASKTLDPTDVPSFPANSLKITFD